MARGFIQGTRNRPYLLPPSIDDWISKDHSVRFIDLCVDHIDLSQFYEQYSHEGKPPYDPKLMLKILIYAYSKGIRSSRKISKACEEEIDFRWLSGNIIPDYSAICRFRNRHKDLFKEIFDETLRLAGESGLIKLENIYLDGTKIKADAALESNRTLDRIRKEVESIVDEAENIDRQEDKELGDDNRGDLLPPELADPQSREERLKAAKARLEAEKAKAESEAEEPENNNSDAEPRGNKEKANITDPDSRIMKTRKGWIQGYNCQAVTDENQFIIATEVTQDCNDTQQLEPMLDQVSENLESAGIEQSPNTISADAGYWREGLDIQEIEREGPEVIISPRKDWKQRKRDREKPPPRGRIPKGLSQRELMERKLRTKRGKHIYSKRGQTVEAVFGQSKEVLGFRRFLLRGLSRVRGEWLLQCSVSNLLKLFRLSGAARLKATG